MNDLMILKSFSLLNIFPFVVGLVITAAFGPLFIPWLHKLKFGQEIREEGPKWHQKKSGTPTMGGIMFIVGIGVAVVATLVLSAVKGTLDTVFVKGCLLPYLIALGFGAIGFVDDYIKVVKKRNLGLTPIQKFSMQLGLAVVYIGALYLMGVLETDIYIPFVRHTIELPMWLYIPFVLFIIVGVVNAVNLTDGLDGLAATVTAVVAFFMAFSAYVVFDAEGLSVFSIAVLGGMLGFLVYNRYPAKVFMGDTGSLFLGAAVALMAIDLKIEIYLILMGFIYFAETFSVIIQTSYFKYTKKKYGEGRRVFKMTPIHHHFEMCGWDEKKIVRVFSLLTALLCIVAWWGMPR